MKPHVIVDRVSSYLGISAKEIRGTRGNPQVIFARHVAMYLMSQLTDKSLAAIGRLFKRDHSSVIHAVNRIRTLCETDEKTKAAIDTITKTFGFVEKFADLAGVPQMDPYVARELHRYGQTTRPEVARSCIEQAVNALRARRGAPTITWPA